MQKITLADCSVHWSRIAESMQALVACTALRELTNHTCYDYIVMIILHTVCVQNTCNRRNSQNAIIFQHTILQHKTTLD